MEINATGLWTAADYGSTPKYNAGKRGETLISRKDREVLRSLSVRVAELACRNIEKEKKTL